MRTILDRVGDAVRHGRIGGEVDDRIDIVVFDGVGDQVPVADVPLHELRAGQIFQYFLVSQLQRVVDDDIITLLQKQFAGVAADVPGPARHQNRSHSRVSPSFGGDACPYDTPTARNMAA
jgi:hypothetical protein